MNFSINLGSWNSVFAVPSELVDKHLKLAGAVHLKVLLWLLRHAGENIDLTEMSKLLGISIADSKDAMQYWFACGLLSNNTTTENEVVAVPVEKAILAANETTLTDFRESSAPLPSLPNTPASITETKIEKVVPIPPTRMKKPGGLFIAERINQNPELGFLMQESQQILGRTLSPGLTSTLLMLYDDYGLPVEVVATILMYAKSVRKDNTHYIEAVGKNWALEGIDTHDKANAKLEQLATLAQSWMAIQATLGMQNHSPSSKEEQFTMRWMHEWNFTTDMIRGAYERCVDSTGKLSFSYMNSILERWHKQNIKNLTEANAEENKKKQKQAKQKEVANKKETTFDIEEYERKSLTQF